MRRALLTWMFLLLACGDAPPVAAPADACGPGALEDASGCLDPGVSQCAEGFVRDGDGCTPVLPSAPCSAGTMAVPGDGQCRAVGLCDAIDAPSDAQHVDAGYTGGVSDGSAEHPWTSIQTAIHLAAPGGSVVIAAGSYAEDLVVDQPVTIIGRCAEQVAIRGTGANAVRIHADGTTLRGVSVTGPERGIWVMGARGVRLEQVRIHGTTVGGLLVGDAPGTEVALIDALIDSPGSFGAWVGGGALTIERSVIVGARGSFPGRGVFVHHGPDTSAESQLTVRRSLIEDNDNSGLTFSCGIAEIEASVFRDSRAIGGMGAGIGSAECLLSEIPTRFDVRGSLIAQSADRGIFLAGSDATIEDTVVRDTTTVGAGSAGIHVSQGLTTLRVADVALSRSLIADNDEAGIAVFGATLAAERVVISGTRPTPGYPYGNGLHLQSGQAGARASASLRGARLDDNAGVSVLLLSADAQLERIAISNRLHVDASPNMPGVLASYVPWDQYPSQLYMHDSDVSGSVFFGVYVINAHAEISHSRIRDIRTAATGRYGDGVAVASGSGVPEASRGSLRIEDTLIEGAARAGLASFGADVAFARNTLACNAISLNGESDVSDDNHQSFLFDDRGGNRCGCGESLGDCEVVSNALEPLETGALDRPGS